MNSFEQALDTLKHAQDLGVDILVTEDNEIRLEADERPPEWFLDMVAIHRVPILAILELESPSMLVH